MEVLGEVFHDFGVGLYGSLRVITTLEFLQHHFSKMGHRDSFLCDPTISPANWRRLS